jgi:hypothetical protein
MKKHIFYHLFSRFNWCDLIQEQISKVFECGLYEEIESFNIVLLSADERNEEWLRRVTNKFEKINIVVIKDESLAERSTLLLLREFSIKRPKDELILYMHTKGITHFWNEDYSLSGSYRRTQTAWRKYMEHFNIYLWRNAEKVLSSGFWDAYGVNLRKSADYYNNHIHYSGNFWWATTDYLSNLKTEYYLEDLGRKDDRVYAEFWIGSGEKPRLYEANESNVNHYFEEYTFDNYINHSEYKPVQPIEYKTEEEHWNKPKHDVVSAWVGIERIMNPMIRDFKLNTKRALEFGVEWGYSTSIFAGCFDEVIGIDTFTGDVHSGIKEDHFTHTSNSLKDFKNIHLVKSDWQTWANEISSDERFDLIHIDIIHDYHNTFSAGDWACKHSDFVIFHDVVSFQEVDLAVKDLARKWNMSYYYYPLYNGLGILTKNPFRKD